MVLMPEEMDVMETAVEALTAIIQHPHTHRYKNNVTKYAANICINLIKYWPQKEVYQN
ncbi:unnamed protein product [Acanthoscelides obtectus]|uniref:Uncharacterized protein n=1 Tax=Acanthoscelides obtectus TaxID=200917 RepID=A0A9P0QC21_ACAOB|nr:unnamed protein product [Acanthoscelides obtectus]CAK1623943.1 hypothetical protein AOBTE_LOCUS2246 [Acanthoscelides obtectus]